MGKAFYLLYDLTGSLIINMVKFQYISPARGGDAASAAEGEII